MKATSIDPSIVGADGVYRHRGPARVFVSETDAIAAIKGQGGRRRRVKADDVVVLIGAGPLGHRDGRDLPAHVGAEVHPVGQDASPIVTDARFSGVSTGACIGHVGPEALAGGPIGKLRDGDVIEIVDRSEHARGARQPGRGAAGASWTRRRRRELLASRAGCTRAWRRTRKLPDDTRLWAALQQASGGTWGGCVYDVDRIIEVVAAGVEALDKGGRKQ